MKDYVKTILPGDNDIESGMSYEEKLKIMMKEGKDKKDAYLEDLKRAFEENRKRRERK